MNRKERRAINRANASLSSGPVTVQGKQIASQNSTTHGLTSLKPYLPAEEEEYKAYAADRFRRLRPGTSAENELATKIVDLEWRLKRLPWLESKLFENLEADPKGTIKSLDILSRHQLRLEKLLTKTLEDFWSYFEMRRKRQAAKALQPNGLVLQNAEALPFADDLDFDAFEQAPKLDRAASTNVGGN